MSDIGAHVDSVDSLASVEVIGVGVIQFFLGDL